MLKKSILNMTQAVPYDDAKAGAAVAVQSFGDFQNFHPHLHVLATDGAFTTTTPLWYAPHLIPVRLKSCFAMKFSKCSKLKAKSLMWLLKA